VCVEKKGRGIGKWGCAQKGQKFGEVSGKDSEICWLRKGTRRESRRALTWPTGPPNHENVNGGENADQTLPVNVWKKNRASPKLFDKNPNLGKDEFRRHDKKPGGRRGGGVWPERFGKRVSGWGGGLCESILIEEIVRKEESIAQGLSQNRF